MTRIRVLWVGDHTSVQERLCAQLAEYGDIELVGQVLDGPNAGQKACELGADVAVIEVAARAVRGLETSRRIHKDCPGCRVLIVSEYEDDETILSAMQAGVHGYLFRRMTGADLAQATRAVAQGGIVLDPKAARVVVEAYLRCELTPRHDRFESLTDREREILILVAEGYTNQQIADLLHISPKTVDTHRTHLMGKLDLHSGRDVVRYALRRRLIDP
jgi:two-component system response regulator NreC